MVYDKDIKGDEMDAFVKATFQRNVIAYVTYEKADGKTVEEAYVLTYRDFFAKINSLGKASFTFSCADGITKSQKSMLDRNGFNYYDLPDTNKYTAYCR